MSNENPDLFWTLIRSLVAVVVEVVVAVSVEIVFRTCSSGNSCSGGRCSSSSRSTLLLAS